MMEMDAKRDVTQAPSPEDLAALNQLLLGYRVSQALYVVVKLGIPDLLDGGSEGIDELAQATKTHAPALFRSVEAGETAFGHVHGMGLFDYLQEHPDAAAIFDRAMTGHTARSGIAITRGYDWSGIERLVDVGGGHGFLLATVLQAHPRMR